MNHRLKMQWTTVGANMAIHRVHLLCGMTCAASHIMLLVGWAAHRTTDYCTTTICFKTLPNISPISSTYLVIWLMNATLLLLAHTRNHRDPPSHMNKKCSTWLYQSHGLHINMESVCGKAGFPWLHHTPMIMKQSTQKQD